ncbi:MAG: DnaB-like helicase C-terminal domain-containing protein [Parvibaculaceae bacterium]|nr:DnaB-like helicase C-terminal domain-containing protein [Parvibaculaceae bacterium]
MSEAYSYGGQYGQSEQEEPTRLPMNIESEQALLGALLLNNDAYDRVSDFLRAEHFFEPLHARLYQTISDMIAQGRTASPVTLGSYFSGDEALAEIGGGQYLAKLAGCATTITNIGEYGRVIQEMALKRTIIETAENMLERAYTSDFSDPPKKQIEDAEAKLYQMADRGPTTGLRHAGSGATLVLEAIERKQKGQVSNSMSTGFPSLDEMIGPQDRGDLMVVAAASSMGKTAFVQSLCLNNALAGKNVAFFSFEMTEEKLSRRFLSMLSGVPVNEIRGGNLSNRQIDEILQAERQLRDIGLYIDATRGIGTPQIRSRARKMKRTTGLDILVVDYIQIAEPNDTRVRRDIQVGQITKDLLRIAGELDCNVIGLSQLSRQVDARDDKRPRMSDLRESGSIEHDARSILMLYREEYYLSRMPDADDWAERMADTKGKAEIIVSKNSEGEAAGSTLLDFDGPRTLFKEPSVATHYEQRGFL